MVRVRRVPLAADANTGTDGYTDTSSGADTSVGVDPSADADAAPASPPVVLEIWPLTAGDDAPRRWRDGPVRRPLAAGELPDEVVAVAVAETLGHPPWYVHSTSWRLAGREVLLTYVALVGTVDRPDDWPVVRAAGRRRRATSVRPVDVLDHSLSHLAFLVTYRLATRAG